MSDSDSVTKHPCNSIFSHESVIFILTNGALNTVFCALSNDLIDTFYTHTNI